MSKIPKRLLVATYGSSNNGVTITVLSFSELQEAEKGYGSKISVKYRYILLSWIKPNLVDESSYTQNERILYNGTVEYREYIRKKEGEYPNKLIWRMHETSYLKEAILIQQRREYIQGIPTWIVRVKNDWF